MLVTRNIPIQSVADHPVEWWTDRNGRKWQRPSLGDVAAGSLILGVVRSYGVDLLWRGRNTPKRALFSDALEELLQDSWGRMSRKTGRHQVHLVAGRANGDVGMWWLALLPLLPPGLRAGTCPGPAHWPPWRLSLYDRIAAWRRRRAFPISAATDPAPEGLNDPP